MSDRTGWRAVVVGSSRYDDSRLNDLPAVGNNVRDLAEALTRPELVGIPRENVEVILDAERPRDVLSALARMARTADDVALFYYAGHGLIEHTDGELHLALAGTEQDELGWTAVEMSKVKELLHDYAHAATRLMILDCCYSGRVLDGMAGAESAVAAALDVTGVVTITSAPRNEPAKAPTGARHTAFTGTLLGHLSAGVSSVEDPWLDLVTLFHHTRSSLQAARLPVPRIANSDYAHRLLFSRNVAFAEGSRGPDRDWTSILAAVHRHLDDLLDGRTKAPARGEAGSAVTSVVAPPLNQGGASGTVHWRRAVGDVVTAGQPLVDLRTEQEEVLVVAPAGGVITRISVTENGRATLGTELAIISGFDSAAALVRLYTEAAAEGHLDAQMTLARHFTSMPERDVESARRWWTAAAEQGHPEAQSALGHLLCELVDPPDLDGARHWWSLAARSGDVSAQSSLGALLSTHVHPPELEEAHAWLTAAAEAGDLIAQTNLGTLLALRTDPPDVAGAEHWLGLAAEAGQVEAQFTLGFLFAELARPRDIAQAAQWWRRAADAGHQGAARNLEMVTGDDFRPPPEPEPTAQAFARVAATFWPSEGEPDSKATVVRWLKQVGDLVKAQEALVEVSSPGGRTTIPAAVGGTLIEVCASEGAVLQAGDTFGVLEQFMLRRGNHQSFEA